jgi:hypothetical protein
VIAADRVTDVPGLDVRPVRQWRPVVEGLTVVVLEQPRLWLMALAGFLVRGGAIVFTLPIVVLPSAVGLANFIGPTSVTAAGPAARLLALFAGAMAIGAVWLALAVLVGSIVDRAMIGAHLRALGLRDGEGEQGRLADLVIIRLVLLIPLAVAIAWASGRIVDAGYQELILPSNLSTPLLVRVALRATDALGVVAVTWLACEAVAAMAVRRSVIDRSRPATAIRDALRHLVRHPVSTLATTALTVLVSVLGLIPATFALSASWEAVRVALVEDGRPLTAALGLAGFLAVWLGGLLIAAVLAAWRSAVWTGEMARLDIARSGDM